MRNFIRFAYGILDVVRARFEPNQQSFVADTDLSTVRITDANVQEFRQALETQYRVTIDPTVAACWFTIGDVCDSLDVAGAQSDPGSEEEADDLFPEVRPES